MDIQQKRLIAITIAASVVVALVGLVFFASTHGILIVNKSGDGEYQYRKSTDQEFQTKSNSSSWSIVPSGDYTVEYKDSNAQYVKYVIVPNFLRSVTVTFTAVVQKQVEQIASSTLDQIVRKPNGELASVNTVTQGTDFLRHATNDPTGLNAVVESLPYSWYQTSIYQDKLFGFVSKGVAQYDFTPAWYDFTAEPKLANKTYDDEAAALLIRPSSSHGDTFGVYSTKQDQTNTLDVFKGTELKYSLNNLKDVADAAEGTKAIAVSENFAAIGFGANYAGNPVHSHSEEENYQAPGDYTVKLYELLTGKELRSVNLGKTDRVASIQVADDGKYISVITDVDVKIYDSTTGTTIFTYEAAGATSPQWFDNDRLLFGTVENGLFMVSAKEHSAVTLFASDVLNLSAFNVTGDEILFTAYSVHRKADSGPSPDGYRLSLNQDTKDDNQLVKTLPFENQQIKLRALGNTIYAAPNTIYAASDDEANGPEFIPTSSPTGDLKTAVTNYLKEHLKNYEQYKLVFGQNL